MTDTFSAIQAMMLNDVNRLSLISQNLANATTPGYKKQVAVNESFASHLGIARAGAQDGGLGATRVTMPSMNAYTDHSSGAVKYTGNPLDLVTEKNAYFAVLTPRGVAYTKQGSFSKDANGMLTNSLGYPLLGESGEIRILNDKPVIKDDGSIYEDGSFLDKVKVVTFAPGMQATSLGFGLYEIHGEQQPDAQGARVRQGYLEMSNVVVMDEMVKMIETMRHFEASQKFMQGLDSMLDNSINIVGEV